VSALDLVRELEEQEASLAEMSGRLVETQATAEQVAAGAEDVGELLARLPEERAASERELAAAQAARSDRRTELDEAQQANQDDQAARRRIAEAERALRRSEDHIQQVERARSSLEAQAERAADTLGQLEGKAREATSFLNALPAREARELASPSSGVDALLDWAPRARAAAFLARTNVDLQRDKLIREAEEAAASVLGESFAGSSLAVVRQRLERPSG
jgi:chromosome segregation ATPase